MEKKSLKDYKMESYEELSDKLGRLRAARFRATDEMYQQHLDQKIMETEQKITDAWEFAKQRKSRKIMKKYDLASSSKSSSSVDNQESLRRYLQNKKERNEKVHFGPLTAAVGFYLLGTITKLILLKDEDTVWTFIVTMIFLWVLQQLFYEFSLNAASFIYVLLFIHIINFFAFESQKWVWYMDLATLTVLYLSVM